MTEFHGITVVTFDNIAMYSCDIMPIEKYSGLCFSSVVPFHLSNTEHPEKVQKGIENMSTTELTPAEREARNAYMRQWKKDHPESVKRTNKRYWEKKAAAAAAAGSNTGTAAAAALTDEDLIRICRERKLEVTFTETPETGTQGEN